MGTLSKEEVNELPTRFETVPYRTFFKLWYALQKSLPKDEKAKILTRIGRTIGKEFDDEDLETERAFLNRLQDFLEKEWAITDHAKVEFAYDKEGNITKIKAKQDSCKMCFANTYYRFHDYGSPSCMFPQVMMGILSKVRNKFGFKNLRFEGVQKGGVGECAMVWNVA
jgi:predicted hydrocarbon binding protein